MPTYYIVQSYSVNRKRRIHADEPKAVRSEEEALLVAKRLAERKIGVIAYSRTGDARTGDWDEPKILWQAGDISAEDRMALRGVG